MSNSIRTSRNPLTAFLVNEVVMSSPPSIRQPLLYCAITHWFDAETVNWMESGKVADTKDLQDSTNIISQLDFYSFVQSHPRGGLAYHEDARKAILDNLRRDNWHQFREWNAKAVRYFEVKIQSAAKIEAPALEFEKIYHLIASDEEKAFPLFDAALRRAAKYYRQDECQTLLSMAEELEELLSPKFHLWLRYYKSVFVGVSGRWEESETILKSLWEEAVIPPDLRYYVAFEIGRLYSQYGTRIEESLGWNRKALELGEAQNNSTFTALAFWQIGANFKRLGQYDRAIEYLNKSLDKFKQAEETDFDIARALLDMGNTFAYMGELDYAFEALEESQNIFERAGVINIAETKHRIGWIQRLRGNLDEALLLHQQAIAIFESIGDLFLRAKALHSMSNVLSEQHDYEYALSISGAALEIFANLKAERHAALVQRDQSWLLFKTNRFDLAMESVEGAIRKLDEIHDVAGIAEGNLIAGRMLLHAGQLERAESFLRKAYDLRHGDTNSFFESIAKYELSLLMIGLHNFEQIEYLIESIERHAQKKALHNLYSRANILHGALALNRGNIDLAFTLFIQALHDAKSWNKYYVLEAYEEIELVISFSSLRDQHDVIAKRSVLIQYIM